jgi:peroxin-5
MSEFSRSGSASPLQLRPEERARMENAFLAHPLTTNHTWQSEFLARPPPEVTQHFHTMPPASDTAFMRDFTARYDMYSGPGIYSPPLMTDIKGKQKMVELDDKKWEEQFRAFEDNMKDDEANKAIDEELNTQESQQFFGDFESIWNGIRAEEAEKLAAGDMDFLDRYTEETFDSNDVFDGRPDLGDYLFEPDNPYMNHPDPFTEGIRLMEVGGSLSEAALAFEAVCQLESNRVDGWTYLGTVQAQNEKELAAIRALEQAIRLDESNLPALMVCTLSDYINSRILPYHIQMKGMIRQHISPWNNGYLQNTLH